MTVESASFIELPPTTGGCDADPDLTVRVFFWGARLNRLGLGFGAGSRGLSRMRHILGHPRCCGFFLLDPFHQGRAPSTQDVVAEPEYRGAVFGRDLRNHAVDAAAGGALVLAKKERGELAG